MPPLTASTVRRLRAALAEQLDALGQPAFEGDDEAAVAVCALTVLSTDQPLRPAVRAAVRASLSVLSERAPGQSLEVRVPPHGAVQAVEGPRHTRGTPPGVVETDPLTWLRLATGGTSWNRAVAEGAIQASGTRADLSDHLPLWRETAHSPDRPSNPF